MEEFLVYLYNEPKYHAIIMFMNSVDYSKSIHFIDTNAGPARVVTFVMVL